jgi:phosphatidylserine/phosphatidylglycerophosphate/cardiolipin synthase-like enzyme
MHSGRYVDGQATPKGAPYDIASGERSNFDQYCTAILAARRSIYIENQQIDVPEIVDCLHRALARDVEVVLLVPSNPVFGMQTQLERSVSRALLKFCVFDNFTLAGIAGVGADGTRKPVYVHSKLMLVDDEWATVGSCNLHRFSLFGNGEMNAAFSDPRTVHTFRCELLQEHLDQDTSAMDDRSALRLFREVARKNRRKLEAGDHAWQGLAFELTTRCNDVVAKRLKG